MHTSTSPSMHASDAILLSIKPMGSEALSLCFDGGHVSTLEVAESHVPFWQACLLGFEIRDQYIQPCQVLWSDEGAEVVGLGLALARGDVELLVKWRRL